MSDVAIVGVIISVAVTAGYLLDSKEDRKLRDLQGDADVLETYIRNFIMAWWNTSRNDDPSLRWRLKVSLINGFVCAYLWRHCRRRPGGPLKVVVHSKYWKSFPGGPLDRNNRIMDEARQFCDEAFYKQPTTINGYVGDQ